MRDSRARRGTEGRADLSCQTFAPIATQTGGKSQVRLRAAPISAPGALEVQPPDSHRLKCKPVSGAVRKQIENFVPLVPDRARTFFSWTPCRTVGTLDAEQDPRRRHRPDTLFYICGFNTMGEPRWDRCFPVISEIQLSVMSSVRACAILCWFCLTQKTEREKQQIHGFCVSVTHELERSVSARVEVSLRFTRSLRAKSSSWLVFKVICHEEMKTFKLFFFF